MNASIASPITTRAPCGTGGGGGEDCCDGAEVAGVVMSDQKLSFRLDPCAQPPGPCYGNCFQQRAAPRRGWPASPRALEPNRQTAAAGINWRMAAAKPASRCSIGADGAKLMGSFCCGRLAPPSHACCSEAFRQRSCRRRSDEVSAPGCRRAASLGRGSLRKCPLGRTLGAGAGLQKSTSGLIRA